MKRLLAFFLAICLCLTGVITAAPQASAEMTLGDPGQENSWRYSDGDLLPADELESGIMPMAAYPSDKTAFGIDVSEHQGQIDWDTVASQIDFAIIRCGFGQDQAGQMDEWFIYNVQACERLGIPYGIYHYAYAQSASRAAGEADHALRLVNTYCGDMFKLPLYYDMEEANTISTASENYARAAAFCDKVTAAGYKAGIYANTNWWTNYLTDSRFNQKINAGTWDRWVAQYSSSCTYNGTYQIWQYTSSEAVNGISGRVDGNYLLVNPATYGIGSSNTPVAGVLSTNKDTYSTREAILVTASTSVNESWVSIYPKGASTSGESLAWYYLKNGSTEIYNGQTHNLLHKISDPNGGAINWNASYMEDYSSYDKQVWGALKPGQYTIYVQKGDYTVVASKDITITAATGSNSLTTDKEFYTLYNDTVETVYVTAYCTDYRAWVGLFPAGVTSYQGTAYSWYYTYNKSGAPVDIWHDFDEWKGGTPWPVSEGEYVIALFPDGGYNPSITKKIYIGKPSVSTDKTTYCTGSAIKITTKYSADGAWVGLYKSTDTYGEGNSAALYWYYIEDAGSSNVNILSHAGDRASEFGAGSYKVILFADEGYTELASKTITVTACADGNKDHKCDSCGKTLSSCADGNNDHKCDTCGKTLSSCADGNKDHKCDKCGKTLSSCADGNNDHKCDTCGKTLTSCADGNKDHKCDKCGATLSSCADGNNDHNCDTCGKTLTSCADNDNNHKCDKCGATLSDCADNDNNHKCDKCGATLSDCADNDNNHKCDKCGATLSDCADNDNNHKCDKCGATLSDCADGNNDHNCDKCGATVSSCADTNPADHKCDTCGATLSSHADGDNNHNCDVCGFVMTVCMDDDDDGDHACDLCGAEDVTDCADSNTDQDHNCDDCGKEDMNDCVDTNPADHKCDVCNKVLGDCSDAAGDEDHDCDHCGKENVTDCTDTDGNNKCDECGATMCEHVDTAPADHNCDKCGKPVSECADGDFDHDCDTCGAVMGAHKAAEGSHDCAYCGEKVSECADDPTDGDHDCDCCGAKDITDCADAADDKDHNCDDCGKKDMNDCVDTDPADHKCDVCGEELSECSDAADDDDHDCDHCGKKDMNDCVDTDPADHKCDVCGEELSECSDAADDDDHDCDHCGKEDITDCADTDGNNKCDECGATICEHVDADPADHNCDKCGKPVSQCADTDKNHKCDVCGAELSKCADGDNNHKCDLCGAELSECADADKDHKCDLCGAELSKCADDDKNHKCDVCGAELSKCIDENKDYKCDICGKDLEKPEDPTDPEQPEQPEKPVIEDVIRLAGANRWETSLKVADEMKANLGMEKFDAIIIASGNDFADALAGSYLSTVKNAPILLGWGKGGKYVTLDEANIAYIKANLAEGGTVYILGGKNAVPELYENELKGYNVKRLGGANRFETNLLILEEAGVAEGSEILVCTSTNFADSLSASATAKPILLVFNEYGKLYGKQPEFLAGLKNCTFTVIGGESAVSADLAKAIEAYGKVERLAGANRFETSVLVAQKYFKAPEIAVLAYAWNYPDGLCGGSLAYSLKAPLILTMTKYEAKAVEYAKNAGIEIGLVLGGDTLISDDAVRAIFAMDKADEIIVK